MNPTLEAIYDGKAFLPVEPLLLKPDTRVRISVVITESERPPSFLKVARSLELEGPEDWSEKLDEYLCGGRRPA